MSKLLYTKLPYLVLVPAFRNKRQIREVSMGLCKTSNFFIFSVINASDLKFCTPSYSSCVYLMMRFKGSIGKVCKMMTSHFGTLFGLKDKCEFVLIVQRTSEHLGHNSSAYLFWTSDKTCLFFQFFPPKGK